MKIRKVFKGQVKSNSRSVYTNEEGSRITETSTVVFEHIGKSCLSWTSPLFTVDGLLPVGTKFTITLEEVEE